MSDGRASFEANKIKNDNEKKLKGNTNGPTLFSPPTTGVETSKETPSKKVVPDHKPNPFSSKL